MTGGEPGIDIPDQTTDETRRFWRQINETMIRGSIEATDNTAKQIIVVAGILEGLYFNGVAFSGLRGTMTGIWPMAIYLSPIALLLLSLSAALSVFFPAHYKVRQHSSRAGQLVFERVVGRKLLLVRMASFFLLAGVFCILLATSVYLRG